MIGLALLIIVLTILGTKNGRALLIQSFRDGLQRIPLSIRQKCFMKTLENSTTLSRALTYIATHPYGNDSKWICKVKKETWQGHWIIPPVAPSLDQIENTTSDIYILYIHGGAFGFGYSTMYMTAFKLMLKDLRQNYKLSGRILSIDYTKSPQAAFPQAQNECVDAYRYLVHELGIPSSRVIIAGDDAGGNLAATLVLSIKSQRSQERLRDLPPLPLPAGLGLISPWSDLTPFHEDLQGYVGTDMLKMEVLARFVRGYIKNYYQLTESEREDLWRDPMVSPYYGDYSGICPVFVSYGEKEALRKSIENYIHQIKVKVTVLEGKGASHGWMLCPPLTDNLSLFESDVKAFVKWMVNTIQDRQLK